MIRGIGVVAASLLLTAFAAPAQGSSLEELSIGSGTGNAAQSNTFDAASADGTRVIFDTTESLTSDDTDGGFNDTYQRANGVTTRLSQGPNGGNGPSNAIFDGASADGKHVVFSTGEQLVSADADGKCYQEAELYLACQDLYERFNGTTSLVSTGSAPGAGTGNFTARYRGMSKDGLHIFFST